MRSDDRSTRAGSVLSGMSIEDMEAAETLNNLSQSNYSSNGAPLLAELTRDLSVPFSQAVAAKTSHTCTDTNYVQRRRE